MRPIIVTYDGNAPHVADDAFVAPGAVLEGMVTLGARSSVWYSSVLRGDTAPITVGADCNVQDGCVLHADPDYPTVLGDRVSLGHGAIVHGATVADDVLIGMRATVMNGATIGSFSLIGAGAVVPPGTQVPPGSLVVGLPGRVRRTTTDDERALITYTHETYAARAAAHAEQLYGQA